MNFCLFIGKSMLLLFKAPGSLKVSITVNPYGKVSEMSGLMLHHVGVHFIHVKLRNPLLVSGILVKTICAHFPVFRKAL